MPRRKGSRSLSSTGAAALALQRHLPRRTASRWGSLEAIGDAIAEGDQAMAGVFVRLANADLERGSRAMRSAVAYVVAEAKERLADPDDALVASVLPQIVTHSRASQATREATLRLLVHHSPKAFGAAVASLVWRNVRYVKLALRASPSRRSPRFSAIWMEFGSALLSGFACPPDLALSRWHLIPKVRQQLLPNEDAIEATCTGVDWFEQPWRLPTVAAAVRSVLKNQPRGYDDAVPSLLKKLYWWVLHGIIETGPESERVQRLTEFVRRAPPPERRWALEELGQLCFNGSATVAARAALATLATTPGVARLAKAEKFHVDHPGGVRYPY